MNALLDTALSASDADWLALLVGAFARGMLILTATAFIAYSLRRSSAAARFVVWSVGLFSLLALPLLSQVMPAWHVDILPAATISAPAPAVSAPAPASVDAFPDEEVWTRRDAPGSVTGTAPRAETRAKVATAGAAERGPAYTALLEGLGSFPWTTWVLIVWLGGIVAVLARLAVAHAGVYLLVRRADPIDEEAWYVLLDDVVDELDITDFVRLRWTTWSTVPLSIGLFKPVILLPDAARTWDAERRRAVLVHELAHAKRRDCLTQLLAQVTCAIHWFNPLAWVAAWQLRVERERACDDVVLATGTEPTTYAETLLQTARSLHTVDWSSPAAVAMARRSQLEGRLLAILDGGVRQRTLSRAGAVLSGLTVGLLALPLAAMRPGPADTPQGTLSPYATGAVGANGEVLSWSRDGNANPNDNGSDNYNDNDNTNGNVDVDPDIDWIEVADADPVAFRNLFAGVLSDSLTIEQMIRLRKYGVDAAYIRALRDLGYTDLSVDELIDLSKFGVDPEDIRSFRAAGFTDLSLDELIDLSKYGADVAFMQEMRAAGFGDLSVDELIEFSKFGVDGEMVDELREAGLVDLTPEELIDASKYGVDRELAAEMQRAGYTNLRLDDYIELSKFGVDGELIASLRAQGYDQLSVDELVDLSKFGIDLDFLAALEAEGYGRPPVDVLVDASKYGVDAAYLREMKEAGLGTLSLEQLAELSKYGVDAAYVREIRDAGLDDFSVDQLIEMRKHGLDADFIREMRGN